MHGTALRNLSEQRAESLPAAHEGRCDMQARPASQETSTGNHSEIADLDQLADGLGQEGHAHRTGLQHRRLMCGCGALELAVHPDARV